MPDPMRQQRYSGSVLEAKTGAHKKKTLLKLFLSQCIAILEHASHAGMLAVSNCGCSGLQCLCGVNWVINRANMPSDIFVSFFGVS